ncbi:uncharacterized protein N7443_002269 [Penicillium atrosanguineum]|uniref:Rho-GAP domain-containing protein n=1 Tax=Penicillium atrosanguineum TaxID=1132637 RepID=A0A9W9PXA4_9EURO|nr:uncharacterized protein N7443_002269 [Penicillium atrosanguineum]KAJ5122168.1 hypothetical protein N7526_009105 [Penicillium atrosanguineum]KAJ5309808.1 hypothetical protein N7443_002269 [Penicillium atrosanguineum]KAJ5315328.1 hypothetical protein N7476_005635 [Penicillium atrosanguineum]
MPFFKDLFRPSSAPRASRSTHRAWPLLRLSRSVPLPNRPEHKLSITDDPEWNLIGHGETYTSPAENVLSSSPDDHISPSQAEYGPQTSIGATSAHKRSDSNEVSQSQHGSKRLKSFVRRLRGSKSQERGSALSMREALKQTAPGDDSPQATTDPAKREVNPPNAPVDPEDAEMNRNVSAQTSGSHESKDTAMTVRRYSSQWPLQELEEGWLNNMLNFHQHSDGSEHASQCSSSEHPSSALPLSDYPFLEQHPQHTLSGHPLTASDPFSDGRVADSPLPTRESSQHSDKHGKGSSGNSQGQLESEKTKRTLNPSTKSHASSRQVSMLSHASVASKASRGSRLSHLDPTKASVAFNALTAKLNLQFHIHPAVVEDITPGSDADEKPSVDEENVFRRHRLFRRVRSVQSSLILGVDSQPPAPRLRRARTFASLGRRADSMSSLQGRSLETLARLGGHSFIVLPSHLAPSPLQLPACIVMCVMYLRKQGASTSARLFIEPGSIKRAISLYDEFAKHVLSAEKDKSQIALTMRVIAMPQNETDASPHYALVVAWALKALLEGLPGGILGSARLYEALNPRVRLLSLAIIALTSEMQCALICAIFGLLTGMLQEMKRLAQQEVSGNALRPVASVTDADRLARVFGPLLIGSNIRDSEPDKVEREVEEQRVAGLLLEHWGGVCRKMREWASGSGNRR